MVRRTTTTTLPCRRQYDNDTMMKASSLTKSMIRHSAVVVVVDNNEKNSIVSTAASPPPPSLVPASAASASYSNNTSSTKTIATQEDHRQHDYFVRSRTGSMEKLRYDLRRYARGNDRRMAIRSLNEQKWLEKFIPLKASSSSSVSLQSFFSVDDSNTSNSRSTTNISPATAAAAELLVLDLEQEINEETIVLNGVVLRPRRLADTHDLIPHAGSNQGAVFALQALTKTLLLVHDDDDNRNKRISSSTSDTNTGFLLVDDEESLVYQRLLVRLAKSTASDSVAAQLKTMLTSSSSNNGCNNDDNDNDDDDLIVRRLLPGKHIVKTAVYNYNNNPIHLDVYKNHETNLYNRIDACHEDGGRHPHIHIELNQTIDFGLFRRQSGDDNRPWIVLKCKIHDRSNLSTNEGTRSFQIQTPNIY